MTYPLNHPQNYSFSVMSVTCEETDISRLSKLESLQKELLAICSGPVHAADLTTISVA